MPLLPCLPEGQAKKDLLPPVALKMSLERGATQGTETSMGMLAKDTPGEW